MMSESEHLSPAEREAIIGRLRQLALNLRQLLDGPGAAGDSLAAMMDEMDHLEGRLDPGDVKSLMDEMGDSLP